ncbi:hypothetical protein BJY04DRAFT_181964 [Aspergillus karnatakaensis]|uniref:uncharacterized protein n=1 Tax=Aspergillus karnatakaensis TaxID=1810916 RepID=UPI003CCD7150
MPVGADGDRPSFAFSFSPLQTRPLVSSPAFTFGSPSQPTNGVNPSSTPRFNFSSFGSTTTTSVPIFGNPAVTSSPPSTSTSTLELNTSPEHVSQDINRNLSSSRTLSASTYRDLYNATPSPQPASDANRPTTNDSHLVSRPATSGVRSSIFQSVEVTPSVGTAYHPADSGSDYDSEETEYDDSTYSVRGEELPRAPIYDVRLQGSLREVRDHLANLRIFMETSDLVHDAATDISDLYGRVETASRFEYPETRIVGFTGDSGVGKSSLINALLDQEALARSSGNGDACTSVVTEFRHIDDSHPQQYTLEVGYMNRDEMNDLLQELLVAYRMRYTKVFLDINDLEEGARITQLAERAFGTLKSLFPDKDIKEEFLSNEGTHAEVAILTQLEEWAVSGLDERPGGPEALYHTIVASDLYDCRENLDSLTVASRDPERPAIWPFVKLIRVYLRSPVLRTGLVLADLPGFRDLNYARVRATERYLRHDCDEVFVVSAIHRCRTDPSIKEISNKLIRDQPLRIVCTKSESQLDAEEAIRDPDIPVPVKTEAERLLNQRQQAEKSLARLSTRRRRSKENQAQQAAALQEATAKDALERLKFELTKLLIEGRNELAVARLSSDFKPDVKVFCVSSKLYVEYREGSKEQAREYVELSGIPELRQYCQSVPAEAQMRATSAFLKNKVPALVGSINQWILASSNSVTVERATTLRRVLDEAQTSLQSRLTSQTSCVRSMEADLNAQFRTLITRCIRGSQERWKAGALRACRDWAGMHHSTYAAFCRKYGVHQAKGEEMRYWNNEILHSANDELSQAWGTLLSWLYDHQDTAEAQINDLFTALYTSLQEYVHVAPEALENLLDNLETQKRCILDVLQKAYEGLLVRSSRLNQDALDGHNSSSYMAQIMHPAYNACKAKSGTGSDAGRKALMQQHIAYSQIFLKFSNLIHTDYTDMSTDIFAELRHKVDEEAQNISRDLRVVLAVEGGTTEAEREPGLVQRVRAGVSSLQEKLNEAQTILEMVT